MDDNQPWPRISIVTPSYNQGQFIEETIRSVLLQGYPNLEYIVIDGGSTDGSAEIIRKYESHLAYWVSEPDGGQANAINKGFKSVTGEVLAWLNSDDIYTPGAIYEAAEYFGKHAECQVAHGKTDIVDAEGLLIGNCSSEPFDLEQLLSGNSIPQPSTFFRRDVFESVGGLDESFQFCLDYDLWLRIATLSSFDYVPRLWAKFRRHPTSKTTLLETLRCVEIVEVLTKWFARDDIPDYCKKCHSKLTGRAHWFAAVELHRARRQEEAIEHLLFGIQIYPLFLRSRELSAALVGSLATQVTTKTLARIDDFFSLIPDNVPHKPLGLRLAVARTEALIALNDATDAKRARRYARQALWRDRIWFRNRHVISRALH
jgi:glycosyltransferase involved in cell wall biosynthesis